jgi:hypothetical protein
VEFGCVLRIQTGQETRITDILFWVIQYLNGAGVLWKSKFQNPLALSSAEAKYYELCEKQLKMFSTSQWCFDLLALRWNVGAIFMTGR